MAFNSNRVTLALIFVVIISTCNCLPVGTPTEEHTKSEISKFDSESVKETPVFDKSDISDATVVLPVFEDDGVAGHRILKRSPRAGVIVDYNCPDGRFMTIAGCAVCDDNDHDGICDENNDVGSIFEEDTPESK